MIPRLCRLRSLAADMLAALRKTQRIEPAEVAEEADVVTIGWADESEAGPMSERPE
jgi:hypothetical protein